MTHLHIIAITYELTFQTYRLSIYLLYACAPLRLFQTLYSPVPSNVALVRSDVVVSDGASAFAS